ncbi:hypothetical protein [Bernardetia litoralis]|uniref:hypothetical protein n=1 Tax=Bernardetia litoralis TaxID=999 RepID=UPI0002DBEE93|nr:hypothetical protein [Bernardetia litoralis]
MCVYEYINLPTRVHAVELFFAVHVAGGKIKIGSDPEHDPEHGINNQIITPVEYLDYSKILKLPFQERHRIFKYTASIENLKKLRGYIRIN